jgi:hypothetical protein
MARVSFPVVTLRILSLSCPLEDWVLVALLPMVKDS